jgi:hypothetical protein
MACSFEWNIALSNPHICPKDPGREALVFLQVCLKTLYLQPERRRTAMARRSTVTNRRYDQTTSMNTSNGRRVQWE